MARPETQKIIMAGFGGQGTLLIGKLLAYTCMNDNRHVTWIPSYGPEMRGGTANCTVIVSDKEIGAPVVGKPDVVIALNRPSMEKFEPLIQPGGLLIYNSSLIDIEPTRTDIDTIKIACSDVAMELGSAKVTNMVALGAYVKRSEVVALDNILSSLDYVISERNKKFIPLNESAIKKGAEFA